MLWIALVGCIVAAIGSYVVGLYIVETDVDPHRVNNLPAYLLGATLAFVLLGAGVLGAIIARWPRH